MLMRPSAEATVGPSTIVVGIDFGPASYAALAWAVGEANDSGREVLAVHAWEPTEEGRTPSCLSADLYRSDLEAMLDRTAQAAPPSVIPIRAALVLGDPRTALVGLTNHAAMLVIGRSSGRWFGRSLSLHCMRHAACPVVTVPQHDRGHLPVASGSWRSGRS